MRGEILLKALETLEEGVYNTADFMVAFLSSTKSDYRPLKRFMPRKHKTLAEEIKKRYFIQTRSSQRETKNLQNLKLSKKSKLH